MKLFISFILVCISIANCDVINKSYGRDKAYGSDKNYGQEKEYGYQSSDHVYGYNADHHREAHGSHNDYRKEENHGYEGNVKSHVHGNYGNEQLSYNSEPSYESNVKSKIHGDYGQEQVGYNKENSYEDSDDEDTYSEQYIYHGMYEGHCSKDGFYYRDQASFVMCANQNAYVQPCAPGSSNSGFDNYNFGDNYHYRDFCDVNLVDQGYGVADTYGYNTHDNRDDSYGLHDHARAQDGYHSNEPYDAKHEEEEAYSQQYIYHGKYEGYCGDDGFYYSDTESFVICSNSNAYVQPCAPGSRNSGLDSYNFGDNYYYRDFCDINLVDNGYGVKGKFGYEKHAHTGYHGDRLY